MNAIENENDIGIGNKIQYYSCNNCFEFFKSFQFSQVIRRIGNECY